MNSLYTEEKYRSLLEAGNSELESLKMKANVSRWKPKYHIHPQFGLLNDPNGLSYYNGIYHAFFQWYPFGTIHGMKHWAHVSSKDLVHWERQPAAIIPEYDYESHGAYSGTAVEIDGELYLYYTGNIKFDANRRSANQCLAIMDKNGEIRKYSGNPIIQGTPDGYTGHVRDPKVFAYKNYWIMLLGAQREDLTGAILLYTSPEGVDWTFQGELNVEIPSDFGYMWECPDYIQFDDKDGLIFSPQGLEEQPLAYNNQFNSILAVGEANWESGRFVVDKLCELDHGFDYYAPQTFQDSEGRYVLMAWAGLGEPDTPADQDGWANCLTLPRVIKFDNGQIKQSPHPSLLKLRESITERSLEKENTSIQCQNHCYELNVHIEDPNCLKISFNYSINKVMTLHYHKEANVITVHHPEYRKTRKRKLQSGGVYNLNVFVDESIVELYINDGELVFTTRFFPETAESEWQIETDRGGTYMFAPLMRAVES